MTPATKGGAMPTQGTVSVLTALLKARTGQQLAANRAWRIDTALKTVLRDRQVDTLEQLVSQLLDGQDPSIADQVVDALLNQESSFFRDAAIFEAVGDAVSSAAADGRRVRLWSAGCATGQEPLSLAMMFGERAEATGAPVPEIIATDVSEAALVRARSGRFSQFEIQRGLPVRRMMRWFDNAGADWVAKPELVRMVQFRRSNLVADAPPPGRFDVVMCRNVLMYLSPAYRGDVFARIATVMRPGGTLVLGAGETVIGQTRAFEPSRRHRGLYEPVAPAGRSAAA